MRWSPFSPSSGRCPARLVKLWEVSGWPWRLCNSFIPPEGKGQVAFPTRILHLPDKERFFLPFLPLDVHLCELPTRAREGDRSSSAWMRGSQSELISALEVNSVSSMIWYPGGLRRRGMGWAHFPGYPPPQTPKTNQGLSGQCLSTTVSHGRNYLTSSPKLNPKQRVWLYDLFISFFANRRLI